mgnify:CR=1 FL=1|tara:strand:- start:2326 stop:2658 length:333 start_codon:yes stop_codon:yes gene_type:complete
MNYKTATKGKLRLLKIDKDKDKVIFNFECHGGELNFNYTASIAQSRRLFCDRTLENEVGSYELAFCGNLNKEKNTVDIKTNMLKSLEHYQGIINGGGFKGLDFNWHEQVG